MAFQLCQPNGPYPKSQVALALGLSRGSLYLKRKQAKKDKQVAIAIEAWHEKDDTMGHRKLGALLQMGKNGGKGVKKKYDNNARRKRKKYVYPGKASSIVPNLLREEKKLIGQVEKPMREEAEDATRLAEIVFSDIFEVQLADHTKVRGCFALWKQTRHILAIAFENHMRADLVVSTIDLIQHAMPGTIFHSDQGSQYGAAQTREALLKKGFIRSMSRAGTPTDNEFAERFVGQFKRSVAERRRYQTLGAVLHGADGWVNVTTHIRPNDV